MTGQFQRDGGGAGDDRLGYGVLGRAVPQRGQEGRVEVAFRRAIGEKRRPFLADRTAVGESFDQTGLFDTPLDFAAIAFETGELALLQQPGGVAMDGAVAGVNTLISEAGALKGFRWRTTRTTPASASRAGFSGSSVVVTRRG